MRAPRLLAAAVAAAAALALAACGGGSDDTDDTPDTGSSATAQFPITIKHKLGTTTIEKKPERVATVQWENHEVPLALGVVPVGMAKANFGDDDGDGMLPWVGEKIKELGGQTPVMFDETDGIAFEAVANTKPDVILATYSGLTQQDYDTLSKIAPVVAYPDAPWATPWRDIVKLSSQALGLEAQGNELIASTEKAMKDAAATKPQLAGKQTMFVTHIDPTDLSKIGYYTSHDTRTQFFSDLGLKIADVVEKDSAGTDAFTLNKSSEQIQAFDDVDVIVMYSDTADQLAKLQADPLLSKIPAVKRGSVVQLVGSTPLATAANPTVLAIPFVLNDYVNLLATAADKVS
ncbi:iron-siderophore ABC transporter substrate-binding protein [Actinoplanes sp. LDG1-06]|uniref:Iron-siderophore ABC transporter substrate-binding protein n=1 Tax=Paractinoplanes ovalisporus TaxID=2810368 RepID=A0ABS2A7D9_9ACTN|nr:iron-siderophore ABC transporter substrate-binding protein [Actinoplanes ovalisporus]MBM2615757.1 iron-siderophore ABC transporter substrate-binding protein [Actinoplanes ovalisporus]